MGRAMLEPEECSIAIDKSRSRCPFFPLYGVRNLLSSGPSAASYNSNELFNIGHDKDNVIDHIVHFKLPASQSLSRRQGRLL